MNREDILKLAEILRSSTNTIFFGGAGVSTESGIPDFRSAEGIYQQKGNRVFSPEEMVSHSFYEGYPEEFFAFYREKLCYPGAEPNACHKALAELENMGLMDGVITQNIDGLHQKAGSRNVIELHGSVLRNYCEKCHTFHDLDYVLSAEGVPVCRACGGRVKPDVVLYEESLDRSMLNAAAGLLMTADTLIVGGTSLAVYPAAGLLDRFRGSKLVLINKSATPADRSADLLIRDNIGEVFAEVMKVLKEEV